MTNTVPRDDAPRDYGLFPRVEKLFGDYMAGRRGYTLEWDAGAPYKLAALAAHADESDPYVRGGKITAHILEAVPVDFDPLDLFAAYALVPYPDGQTPDSTLHDELQNRPEKIGNNWGHCTLDYARVMREGIKGIVADIDARLAATNPDDRRKRNFYTSLKLSLDAVVHYAGRYRQRALERLSTESDPKRRAELERIAAALSRVPFEPARTLFEALQTLLLCHVAGLITHARSNMLGRVDYILDEFYTRDLAAGTVTPQDASEWMQVLYVKSSELVYLGDAMTIGGCDAHGKPFWNDLTYFILDALKAVRHFQPQIGFRYARGMPHSLLARAFMPLRAGVPQPGFFNDDVCVPALRRAEFDLPDARNYVNCACVELTAAGQSSVLSGYCYRNLAKPIETLLNKGVPMVEETHWTAWAKHEFPNDVPVEFAAFEEFRESYRLYVGHLIRMLVERTNTWQAEPVDVTFPFPSALLDGCIETGLSAWEGGARYMQTFPNFTGLVTAADSLCAIRQAVFEDKKFTLDELADLCRSNFAGRDDARMYLLNRCPKYGNGNPVADAMAAWVYDVVVEELAKHKNIHGYTYAPCYFGEMQYGPQANGTAATPDGRRHGEAVTPSLGGDQGRDRAGLTALVNSITSFDHTLTAGGLAANFAVSPTLLKTDADIDGMIGLLLTYFDKGGMQAQFNCVSGETLRLAQTSPENHQNVLVRVAGFSGYFVQQIPEIQNQIIERAEHASR